MTKFTVKRAHIGDRAYAEGETREVDHASVQHLVRAGVLVAASDAAPQKKQKAPANKVAPKVDNKAATQE